MSLLNILDTSHSSFNDSGENNIVYSYDNDDTVTVDNNTAHTYNGGYDLTGPAANDASDLNESTDSMKMFPCLSDFRDKHIKNFNFAHLNINWFHSKFMEVHEILRLHLVDMLILGESKLHPEIHMNFKVDDYTFYRNDRPGVTKSTAGGGLVAYVSSSIPHRERKDIAFNQDGIETIVFEVAMKKEKWFFIGIYRPGSVGISHLKSAIEHMCQQCSAEGKATFILGYINVDFLKILTQYKMI